MSSFHLSVSEITTPDYTNVKLLGMGQRVESLSQVSYEVNKWTRSMCPAGHAGTHTYLLIPHRFCTLISALWPFLVIKGLTLLYVVPAVECRLHMSRVTIGHSYCSPASPPLTMSKHWYIWLFSTPRPFYSLERS